MEEQEDYGFIYITECLINGKMYIGQKKFRKGHRWYLGGGTIILRAIKTYGRKNFSQDIIEICSSSEELDEKEIFWIAYYDALKDENFYNLCAGGSSTTGRIFSEESKQKMSKSHKGYVFTDEQREKLSKAGKGRVVTAETRKKMSEASKGNTSRTGMPHSEETKKKMSEAQKGRPRPEYLIAKNRKPILQYDLNDNLIKKWDSILEITRCMGISRGMITKCCKHRQASSHKYKWEYAS